MRSTSTVGGWISILRPLNSRKPENLDAMQKFYEEVIGLPLMARDTTSAFFKIAAGYGGHTQVLALFDRSQSIGYCGANAATSTIDHIAFEIPLADFADELTRLKGVGLEVRNC